MPEPNNTRIVIASITSSEDQACLQCTLATPRWEIRFTRGLADLSLAVRATSSGVVISDRCLGDGSSWKDVLAILQGELEHPQLIVADRLANEALWAEVLNLGGYDLLISPFEPDELHRIVSLAWEFRVREITRKRTDCSRPGVRVSAA
jgi:DNA-binding NtrC family response regulator